MRAVFTIIFLHFLLTSCSDSSQQIVAKTHQVDTTQKSGHSVSVHDTLQRNIDITIIHADTASINGQSYIAFYKSDDILYVVNNTGDTILKVADLHPNFEFDDFNGDGFKDIRIHYMSNVPAVQELLLFDKTQKTFKIVEDFSMFPDPNPLKGSKYYYSYHRSGCADMNWDSDLFYLDKYKAIRIGNIAGYECKNRDVKDGIYIHRVKGDKEILLETKSINIIEKYKDYKWGFIKDYWAKNYKRFL